MIASIRRQISRVSARARLASITGPMTEGSSGNIARVSITNDSTRLGFLVEYTFGLAGVLYINEYAALNINEQITALAGATVTKDYSFSIPSGIYGAGSAQLVLMNTERNTQLSTVARSFTVSPALMPPVMAQSHQLPATMYTNQPYVAQITLTNPNASSQTYKVMVGIGCYPGVFPERCTVLSTSESQGGRVAARTIGAGQTSLVPVQIFLDRLDAGFASGYAGKLAVVCHVVDSNEVVQIANQTIGTFESFPYVQKL